MRKTMPRHASWQGIGYAFNLVPHRAPGAVPRPCGKFSFDRIVPTRRLRLEGAVEGFSELGWRGRYGNKTGIAILGDDVKNGCRDNGLACGEVLGRLRG